MEKKIVKNLLLEEILGVSRRSCDPARTHVDIKKAYVINLTWRHLSVRTVGFDLP